MWISTYYPSYVGYSLVKELLFVSFGIKAKFDPSLWPHQFLKVSLKPCPWPTHQDYLFRVFLITMSSTRIELLAILKHRISVEEKLLCCPLKKNTKQLQTKEIHLQNILLSRAAS